MTLVRTPTYVLGIVASGSAVPVSDGPLSDLRLVDNGRVAAVVATPPTDRPLGRGADLLAHDRLLGELVADGVAVLPMRFGTVLPDDESVLSGVVDAECDALLAELEHVTGRVQFTVRVRYDEDAVLRQIVAEEPEIRRLRSPQGGPETSQSRDRDIRLGQSVVRALERRRPADADGVIRALGGQIDVQRHEPSSPEEVLHVAYLVDATRADAFERRVEQLAQREHGRLRIRLVGPSPAYDFVGRR